MSALSFCVCHCVGTAIRDARFNAGVIAIVAGVVVVVFAVALRRGVI